MTRSSPKFRGCRGALQMAYQEAVANVEVFMREWIETARSLKRQIPVPGGK
jgi:hypothetical protein